MCQKTAHVNFETTPSDFGAQIRESQQIKALSPLYNRRLRKTRKLYQLKSSLDDNGYLRLSTEAVSSSAPSDQQFGLFRSPRQASIQLEKLADQYFLCHQLIGLKKALKRISPALEVGLKNALAHAMEQSQQNIIMND